MWLYDKLGNSNLQLSCLVIGAIVSFFPIFANIPSNLEQSILASSLTSSVYRESSFAILSLSAGYTLEFLIDKVNEVVTHKNKNNGNSKIILLDMEMLVYILGTMIVPIIAFLPFDTPRLALIYTCASRAQLLLIGGFVAVVFSRKYRNYFPTWTTIIFLTCFPVCLIVQAWIINDDINDEMTPSRWAFYYIEWFGGIVLLISALIWLYCEFMCRLLLPRMRRGLLFLVARGKTGDNAKMTPEDIKEKQAEDSAYFPIIYVFCCFLFFFFMALSNTIVTDWYHMTPANLLIMNIPVLVFQLSIFVIRSQFSQYEISSTLLALLASKASYVRYISHELRTPMNTACMGLGMLLSEMERRHSANGSTAAETDRYETVSDINVACMAAVDTLNELLSFEKMESGVEVLHKEDVPALNFVQACLRMFAVHGQSKQIDLVYLYEVPSDDPTCHALRDCDKIHLDKFKCEQVIRNLVSNALKVMMCLSDDPF